MNGEKESAFATNSNKSEKDFLIFWCRDGIKKRR